MHLSSLQQGSRQRLKQIVNIFYLEESFVHPQFAYEGMAQEER
jgi:hypothetical protein